MSRVIIAFYFLCLSSLFAMAQQGALVVQADGRAMIDVGGEQIDLINYLIPTGTILPFGGTVIPDGWELCDGM